MNITYGYGCPSQTNAARNGYIETWNEYLNLWEKAEKTDCIGNLTAWYDHWFLIFSTSRKELIHKYGDDLKGFSFEFPKDDSNGKANRWGWGNFRRTEAEFLESLGWRIFFNHLSKEELDGLRGSQECICGSCCPDLGEQRAAPHRKLLNEIRENGISKGFFDGRGTPICVICTDTMFSPYAGYWRCKTCDFTAHGK